MSSSDDTHEITTEDELRALAHPLRLRILGLLRVDGPATASGLGERLGESSGVTSYHLRYLAQRAFVEEAPELGTKRERWWRASEQMTEWNSADFLDSPGGRAADLTFRREALRYSRSVVDNWLIEETTWPREWVGAAIMSDVVLQLSLEQLQELDEDYRRLLEKYIELSERNRGADRDDVVTDDTVGTADPEDAAGTGDTERVYAIFHAVPVRELNP